MQENKTYIDIILPLALNKLYTYSIDDMLINDLEIGLAVIVQFGKKKLYTGIIKKIHNNNPKYDTKDINAISNPKIVINKYQLELWEWIAEYYMCTLGDVYKAALPAGLKVESQTKILLKQNDKEVKLSKNEEIIITNLDKQKPVPLTDLALLFDNRNPINTINKLIAKDLIEVEEKIRKEYKPKTADFIEISPEIKTEDEVNAVFEKLKHANKQSNLFLSFIGMSEIYSGKPKQIEKSALLLKSKSTPAILKSLINKKILQIKKVETDRLNFKIDELHKASELNKVQKNALNEIKQIFKEKNVVLLHGVTGSGKTEIYLHLIKKQLEEGKQVLYLLPEIAITTQIINRLRNVLGDIVGVYHSKFNDNERIEVWKKIAENKKYKLIVGVRSSVFLPFNNLGLIIVDEEHENSYKQFNPAPRYNARDTSVVLANIHSAKVLMGTATPAIETMYNTKIGKYGYVQILERFDNYRMPDIEIYDIKDAKRRKIMKSLFSNLLLEKIDIALKQKKQIILFQNRRGFSPYLICDTCGWVPQCENCNVSLTYHKFNNKLVCHYCGYTIGKITKCLACESTNVQTKGFGTEKIEDEIKIFFPEAKVKRFDLDTTRNKNAHEEILSDFDNGKIDILAGTQMVSKGLDFKNVSLVGIINADDLLNFPDFRAHERSFQLLTQVSGRAGRSADKGEVIIQTHSPKHNVLKYVIDNDFESLFNEELAERKEYMYPPFCKIIKLNVKHKRKDLLEAGSVILGNELKKIFGERVLGPDDPMINRIQLFYIKEIIIKIENTKSQKKAKEIIKKVIDYVNSNERLKSLIITANVDPM
jgi:primosomal protein N' (replication factor Y)